MLKVRNCSAGTISVQSNRTLLANILYIYTHISLKISRYVDLASFVSFHSIPADLDVLYI